MAESIFYIKTLYLVCMNQKIKISILNQLKNKLECSINNIQ